ncbi:hypothetical protein N665_0129s0048 [Sinapis alba]|nr:hypothetical protein N665_0129s0048 [Sinapis alba]
MASDESMVINSSSVLDEEYDDTDDGFHYQTRQSSLSRLSICTSSFHDDDEDNFTSQPSELGNFMSELSLESFDDVGAEADGEISDGEDSDSDKESAGFYSLPTIMSRRRRKVNVSTGLEKDNEVMNVDTLVKKKSMKMDFEEVKACRDLRFDLEVPGRVSVSNGSNRETQTSSGSNSPIANWRISSPGDDPKEVKARLKMWAQAVALASTSR